MKIDDHRIRAAAERTSGELAIDRGVAFQLTNILRDLREDAARGRTYLPKEDLIASGVTEADIQIVSNEAGEPTAVIVPIALWKEIAAERETAYLLKSEPMRQRLRAALERASGVSLDDAVAKLGL